MSATDEILPLVKEVVKAYKTGMEWKLLKEVAESEENFPYHPESIIGQIEKWIESVDTATINSPRYAPEVCGCGTEIEGGSCPNGHDPPYLQTK